MYIQKIYLHSKAIFVLKSLVKFVNECLLTTLNGPGITLPITEIYTLLTYYSKISCTFKFV